MRIIAFCLAVVAVSLLGVNATCKSGPYPSSPLEAGTYQGAISFTGTMNRPGATPITKNWTEDVQVDIGPNGVPMQKGNEVGVGVSTSGPVDDSTYTGMVQSIYDLNDELIVIEGVSMILGDGSASWSFLGQRKAVYRQVNTNTLEATITFDGWAQGPGNTWDQTGTGTLTK